MFTTITTFRLPKRTSIEDAREIFLNAAPNFQTVPGLLRKQFLLSDDGKTAGGVYLWKDRDSAESFNNEKLVVLIKQQFGVEPEINYFSSPVIVDNLSGEVIT